MAQRRRHAAAAAALLALATIALTGCPKPQDPPLQAETQGTKKPAIDKTADKERAKEAVLALDDLPGSDWKHGTTTTTSRAKNTGGSFDCPEVTELDDTDSDSLVSAQSPDLQRQQPFMQVSNEVIIVADEDQATERLDGITAKAKELKKCMERGFSHDFAKEGKSGDSSVVDWKLSKMGDARLAFDFTVSFENEGQTLEFHIGFAFVRVGRAMTLLVIAQLDPLDDEAKQIVQTATDKLRDKVSS